MKTFLSLISSAQVRTAGRGCTLPLLAGLLFGAVLFSTGTVRAASEREDLAVRISGAPVFYQQLLWVGPTAPTEAENQALWNVVSTMGARGAARSIPDLEQFLAAYPDSAWGPSLRANLARYYREHGRYTTALDYWESAWNATREAKSGPAKRVADFTFAYWTSLLASLGRTDTLRSLFQETQGRVFDGGPLQQVVNGTKEGYQMMLYQPGVCFKCGTFALDHVGRALKGTSFDNREMEGLPSPRSGFSMTTLVGLADRAGLDLVPAHWGPEQRIVVPSVVHWKQDHYAAILQERKGSYRVVDPTFGGPRWLGGDVIRSEASGDFLIPRTEATAGWKLLAAAETDRVFGRGNSTQINNTFDGCSNGSGGTGNTDNSNNDSNNSSSSSSSSGSGGGPPPPGSSNGGPTALPGGPALPGSPQLPGSPTPLPGSPTCTSGCGSGDGGSCPTCMMHPGSQGGNNGGLGGGQIGASGGLGLRGVGAMPYWAVSEPYIDVWLYDEPLGYQPGVGSRISFKLAYKQRESREMTTNLFSLGPMWDCSWISYIMLEGETNGVTGAGMEAPLGGGTTYSNPGGGLLLATNTTYSYALFSPSDDNNAGPPEALSSSFAVGLADTNGNVHGAGVAYPDGSVNYYNFIPTNLLVGMQQIALLSDQVDPYGHTNHFSYEETGSGTNPVVLLQYVIDADGRTNTILYTNSAFPAQITGVEDPFGRTTILKYSSAGMLTNVTDVAGLSSSFACDFQGWVTNMITPYGTTTFTYYTNTPGGLGDTNEFDTPDDTNIVDDNFTIRAVTIVDPMGATNVYALRQATLQASYDVDDGNHWEDIIPNLYPSDYYPDDSGFDPDGAVPTTTYTGTQDSFSEIVMYFRDSFHWGPRQAVGLPPDLNNCGLADFARARMRHWLHAYDSQDISQVLGDQVDPSPDGIQHGQITWYTYQGKTGLYGLQSAGTNTLPLMIAQVMPDGTTWFRFFQRDIWGHPTNVVETWSSGFGATPVTRTNLYLYDTNNIDLLQVVGPQGETLAGYVYDGTHQLLTATDAAGDSTSYAYDSQGRLTSVHSPAGLTTTNIYYGAAGGSYSNWVETRIDLEIGRTNSFGYTNDLIWVQTNELGLVTTNLYDNLQRLTNSSDPRGAISITYNKLDVARVVDRLGLTNSFGYDANRRRTDATNALGNHTHYDYCACGSLDDVVDPLGNTTYFYYDNAGWLTNAVYPDATSITNFWSLLAQVTNTVDSAGHSVTNWFDNQGLRYAVSNAFGQVSLIAFDVEDRATNTVDANGVSINQAFDSLGRLTSRTYPDGGVEAFGYSAAGLIAYTNQLTDATHYGYDAARRKVAETNANNEVTSYTYDPAGDLLTLTDGKSDTTTWHYDVYGMVSNKVDASNNVILVYHYDADSRLTNRWSAAKTNTSYSYDAAGNLTNVGYPVSHSIGLVYDADNRLTSMLDGVGTTVYAYDNAGQIVSETGPWDDDMISYGYTARQRTSLTLLQPNADPWRESYSYDAARRQTNVTSAAGGFGYGYDPTCQMLVGNLALPNGAYITNTYDSVARLLTTELQTNGVNLDAYTYAYNLGNQRTQQVFTAGDFVNYAYDPIGQLKSALGQEPSGGTNRLQEQLRYAYDAAHNLNYRTNNGLVETFNVNALNELATLPRTGTLTVAGTTTSAATNVTVNSSTATLYGDATFAATNFTLASNGSNTFTAIANGALGRHATNSIATYLPPTNNYTYDLNGNLLSDGNRCFAYDDENELISVWVTNAWRSAFAYDGKMRRRVRKEFTWIGGVWSQTNEVLYVYDGNLVIQERDQNNLPRVTYTRGNDLSGSLQGAGGIGGLLARTDHSLLNIAPATAHAFYHTDGNGNVTALVNNLQQLVAQYLYDPYGNVLSERGPLATANTYQFSSKEWNQSSGLVYYLYRFYDPALQRWVNRDPVTDAGFRHLHASLPSPFVGLPEVFAFVHNSPVERIDPAGLVDLGNWSISDLQAIINNLSDAMERLPVGSPEWQSAYAARAALYRQLSAMLARQAALRAAAGRVCLVGGAFLGGVAAGDALGNWTPYPGGGTINAAITDNFVPFWNWWYGYQAN